MAELITVQEAREHLETDITDAALTRVLDSLEADIVARFGENATQSDYLEPHGGYRNVIYPTRKVATVTSATEVESDGTETVLDPSDYAVVSGGARIDRKQTGANPRTTWAPAVKVVYVPEDSNARRVLVLIDLAKIELQYNGLASESVGDWSGNIDAYEQRREEIMRRLGGRWFA